MISEIQYAATPKFALADAPLPSDATELLINTPLGRRAQILLEGKFAGLLNAARLAPILLYRNTHKHAHTHKHVYINRQKK